jgi:hypothetical protein
MLATVTATPWVGALWAGIPKFAPKTSPKKPQGIAVITTASVVVEATGMLVHVPGSS